MSTVYKLILRRAAFSIGILCVVSLFLFLGVELLPGDIAESILGQDATPEGIANLRLQLGLDQPAYVRYLDWLGGILNGDLGQSLATNRGVAELIAPRMYNTLFLAAFAAATAIPLAICLGILAAVYRGTFMDRIANIGALVLISVPEFLICYVLISWLSVKLGLFPSLSNIGADTTFGDRIYRTILPATTLTLVVAGYLVRMTRSSLVEVLSRPYIQMAELKGQSKAEIVFRHALPNALAPIANAVALSMAYMIVGVVVVESILVYPGVGQLLVDSVSRRDIPVVQACSLFFALTYIALNLASDVVTIVSDPRLMHPR